MHILPKIFFLTCLIEKDLSFSMVKLFFHENDWNLFIFQKHNF